ncbi:MAG: ArsR/SmtB family transcription factor [Burkholderiales bacterium]
MLVGGKSGKMVEDPDVGRMFESAASYLSLLSEPTRLRILHSICNEEKSVNTIVAETGATQTNVSRHLSLMHRSRVLERRRDGNVVYYSVADRTLVEICRAVCVRVAADLSVRIDESIAAAAFQPPGKKPGRRARQP